MKELIEIILKNKDELNKLSALEFVKKFNEIVSSDKEYAKNQFIAFMNNRDGNWTNEGYIYIIDESKNEIIYTYHGYNCSCNDWTETYGGFNIVKDILGSVYNHNCLLDEFRDDEFRDIEIQETERIGSYDEGLKFYGTAFSIKKNKIVNVTGIISDEENEEIWEIEECDY